VIVLGLMCGSEMKHRSVRSPDPPQPTDRGAYSCTRLLREAVWSHHAFLDGPFYFAQSSSTSAFRAFEQVGFSLIGPVPINNRIARWAPDSLPSDWHAQENRSDVYHWLRTLGLVVAFLLLALGLAPH
jgi:hypothetical protein